MVATRRHTLLFDTGPTYRSGFSTAKAVVIPYLRWRNTRHLDVLIASHGDNDHAGGIAAIEKHLEIGRRLGGGEVMRLHPHFEHCRKGDN